MNDSGQTLSPILSPAAGNNGLWIVNTTDSTFNGIQRVVKVEVCLEGSGAISFIEFYNSPECDFPSESPTPAPSDNIITGVPSAQPTPGPTPQPSPQPRCVLFMRLTYFF